MGSHDRTSGGAMTQGTLDRLLTAPQRFNLFQAISLLERAAPHAISVGCSHAPRDHEAVRLSAFVSLSFEPSDIRGITSPAPTGEPFFLSTPALSLAGADGPLPQPFTELLLQRSAQRDHATADFLDIFNHRLLAFLYRSRRKHHVSLNATQPSHASLASTLDSISALGQQTGVRAPDGSAQWLRHAGLLGGTPRSMVGLLAVLRDRLKVKVTGTQFLGSWRMLEPNAVSRLHSRLPFKGTRIGHSAVLGRKFWDQGAGLHLDFTDMSRQQLHSMLPGGDEHALAHWLVRRYAPQDLEVRMALRLAPNETQPSRLSVTHPMRLGWTSWLTSIGTKKPLTPVILKLTRATSV